jgi:hypothetical protein
MSATKWSDKDTNSASKEGWCVFSIGDSKLQLQRCDEMSVFQSDAHAIEFVLERASSSKLHRRAIKAVYGF